MEYIIPLILIILIEIFLMVYRIKVKSFQYKATILLRVATFVLIVVFISLSVITWSWRYYGILIALILTIIINGIKSLSINLSNKRFGYLRIITKSLITILIFIITLIPAIIFPIYNLLPTTGDYEITTVTKILSDENRIETYSKNGGPRTLVVEFWYPDNTNNQFPLILFSHGSFGTRTSNETLFRELASHGYVVCSIDHTYQCLYTTEKDGKTILINTEYMKELQSENARVDKQNSFDLYKKWMNIRVGDINFVIDSIKADSIDSFYKLIDVDKIGVMGHSLGGSAALGIGRIRNDVSAVVALESPFMCDIIDVVDNKFIFAEGPYPVPVLNIYSDSSWDHLREWPQYRKNVELLSSNIDDVYNVHIEGVGHLSLTDLSLASPFFTRILNGHPSSISAEDCLKQINEECLVFFNAYLKNK